MSLGSALPKRSWIRERLGSAESGIRERLGSALPQGARFGSGGEGRGALPRSSDWNKQQDRNMQKRTPSYGYPIRFNDYCYRCNNYGHKAINCRVRFPTKVNEGKYTFHIQCYNCHYYGHIARDCRMQGRLKVWKRKKQACNTMQSQCLMLGKVMYEPKIKMSLALKIISREGSLQSLVFQT